MYYNCYDCYDNYDYPAPPWRQLPTASTLPGYPTMQTEPIYPYAPDITAITPYAQPAPAVTAPSPVDVVTPAPAPVLANIGYLQAYLRTLIGRSVRIDFLIGTNTLIDRGGVLTDVGISYVVLRETETGNDVVADLYSIKFVTVFNP